MSFYFNPKRSTINTFNWKLVFYFFLLASIFSFKLAVAEDANTDFKKANDLYKLSKFQEAEKIYENLAGPSMAQERAVFLFNLANSQYRSGKTSKAIWNYERALAINPWYADARYNLKTVQAKLEYKIEDRRNLFMRLYDFVLKWLKFSELAALTLSCLLVFFVSTFFWMRQSKNHHFWAFPRGEFFVLSCFFAVLLGAQTFYKQHYAEAIVLVSEADVRYGPSVDNQSLMKLGGGLKVYIVDSREDWSRVVTWNGETGWMRNSEIGRVDA